MRCSRGIPIYNYTLQSPYYGKHNPITALLIIISFHGFEKVHISVVGCYCGGGWSSYRVCHLPLLLPRAPPSPPPTTPGPDEKDTIFPTPLGPVAPPSPPPQHTRPSLYLILPVSTFVFITFRFTGYILFYYGVILDRHAHCLYTLSLCF